jgi:DnaJ-class molecular chaperone
MTRCSKCRGSGEWKRADWATKTIHRDYCPQCRGSGWSRLSSYMVDIDGEMVV